MRRAVLLAMLVFAAPAQAAALPSASVSGVRVNREFSGSYRLLFTKSAYRPLAGRRITITCASAAPRSPAAAPPRRFDSEFDAPRKPKAMFLRPAGDADVCALAGASTIVVGLDARGRAYLADARAAGLADGLVTRLAQRGRRLSSWPTRGELTKAMRTSLVHLAVPSARPPEGRVGYYSDGRRRMSLVASSASGSNVFIQTDGDEVTTNLLGLENVFGTEARAPSGLLPVGDFPAAGTPLPAATVDGVAASQDGGQITVTFSGDDATAAYGRLAGRSVQVDCLQTSAPVLGLAFTSASESFTMKAPDSGDTLRLDVTESGALASRRYDVCSLATAPGAPVVQVAVGAGARALLEEGVVSGALRAVARRTAGDGTTPYASTAALADSFGDAIVPLSSPADTPGDRRVGVYSDGQSHLAVVARALTGRRLFAEYTESTVKTNLFSVTDLLP